MRTKYKNRFLSLILTLAMVFSLVVTPVSADADTTEGTETSSENDSGIATIDDDGDDDSDSGTASEANTSYVAMIGDAGYETLAAAIEEATDGQTITLTANVSESTVTLSKSITLDLSSYTLTTSYIYVATDDVEVTVKNGIISGTYGVYLTAGKITLDTCTVSLSSYIYCTGGELYLDSTTVTTTGDRAIGNYDSSTVTIDKDSTVNAANGVGVVIWGDGSGETAKTPTLNVYGEINANVCIQGNGTDYSGTIINLYSDAILTATTLGMYLPQPCTVNITGATVTGSCAIGIKSGTLNISGSSVITGSGEYDADLTSTTNGINVDGSAIVIDSYAGYAGDVVINITADEEGNSPTITSTSAYALREISSTESTNVVSISISAGTISGGEGAISVTEAAEDTISITGGTYSSDVTSYIDSSYSVSSNEDGTYTVTSATVYVATVTDNNGDVTSYTTLAAAAEYANSLATGKSRLTTTITMLKDITLTEQVTLKDEATTTGDYLILDLNEHTITADVASGYALYLGSTGSYGKVTVQNGTIIATANAYGAIEINNEAAILTSLTLSSQTAGHGTILVDSVYGSAVAFTDLTINTTDGYCLEFASASTGNLSLAGTNTYIQTTGSASSSQTNACIYMTGSGSSKVTVGSSATVNLTSDGYGVYITGDRRLSMAGKGTISGTTKGVYVNANYSGTYSALEVTSASTIAIDGGVTSDVSDGKISISAGNYEYDLEDTYVASGYECILDTDSTSDTYGRYIIQEVYVAEVYNSSGTKTGSYNSLSGAISAASSGYTVKLIDDCSGSSYISITKNLTIDLNGHKYTSSTTSNAALYLSSTSTAYTLTITDTSTDGGGSIICTGTAGVLLKVGKVIVTGKATVSSTSTFGIYVGGYTAAYTSAKAPTVTVEESATVSGVQAGIAVYGDTKGTGSYGPIVNVTGGTVEGTLYGIAGNGTTSNPGNTFINISGGTVQGTDTSDSTGIYHPQLGTLTVTGGTIIGYSAGIEMRAGTLSVSGGSISATTETATTYTANDSGTTVVGAGIAISQHSTNNEITVNITGGTISGSTGIYEVNTFAGTNTSTVTITISEADEDTPTEVRATNNSCKAIYSESISGATTGANSITTIAISGGHFSTDLANTSSYIAEGYSAYTEADSTDYYINGIPYTVGKFAEFYTRTLTLDGSISVNYYVDMSKIDADDYENYTVKFTSLDGTNLGTAKYNSGSYRDDLNGDTPYYRFTVSLTAVQMATKFTAELQYKGVTVQKDTYSVRTYCERAFENNWAEKDLCAALLNYGGYAQTYVDSTVDEEDLANYNLSSLYSGWTDPVLDNESWSEVNLSGYTASASTTQPSEIDTTDGYFASLVMDSEMVIRIYFNLASGKTTSDVTFSVNGTELKIQTAEESSQGYNAGYYYYVALKVPASKLSTTYTFNVSGSNTEENGTISYSALAYVNKNTSNSDALADVCKAIYYYSVAANNYTNWYTGSN